MYNNNNNISIAPQWLQIQRRWWRQVTTVINKRVFKSRVGILHGFNWFCPINKQRSPGTGVEPSGRPGHLKVTKSKVHRISNAFEFCGGMAQPGPIVTIDREQFVDKT
jgi:hypothetical protein